MASSFPAPLPKSPMAGVTSPTMMSGMANERNSPNSELNVTNTRVAQSGKNCPKTIPATIAMTTLANREILSFFFMVLRDFIADDGDDDAHQRTD